jgi:hypothetical protein
MPATAVMAIPIRALSWVAVRPFSAGFSRKAPTPILLAKLVS